MTKVINLYGGPGSGKSTLATGIFSEMKRRGYLIEYVSEYAKDITWEQTQRLLDNQLHVFSEQHRRQWRLQGQVDYIVTDSPLLLSYIYFDFLQQRAPQQHSQEYADAFRQFVVATYLNEFDNIDLRIHRNKPYVPTGRNQTEAEAIALDDKIVEMMHYLNLNYGYQRAGLIISSDCSPKDAVDGLVEWNLIGPPR